MMYNLCIITRVCAVLISVLEAAQSISISNLSNEALQCRDALDTHNYGYSKFYHISTSGHHSDAYIFNINFRVRAKSDAHILLSPTADPDSASSVYEIVLGAGKNRFSDIRRLQRTGSKQTTATPDLLHANELRTFWIRLTLDGILQVGKWNDDLPFIFWQDPEPLRINYFSFCSWGGVWGKWQFNCVDNTTKETIEAVIKPISVQQQLRKDLLSEYDPYVRPAMLENQRTVIFIHLKCHQIKVDEKKSILSIHGTFTLQWTDDKIHWNLNDYANISTLHISHHEIWQPEIILYNAAGLGTDILGQADLNVDFDGIVTWKPTTQMAAWCDLDLGQWPNDVQVCEIKLGLWSQEQLLELAILENGSGRTLDDQRTGSEWQLLQLISETTWSKTPWTNTTPDTETDKPYSAVTLQFTLRRQNNAYHKILKVPLIVISIMSLLPFWMSPVTTGRFSLLSLDLVLITMFLLGVGTVMPAPADQLPNIIVVYLMAMSAVTLSMIYSIFIIGLVRYTHLHTPPNVIRKVLSKRLARIILLLPQVGAGCNPSDATAVKPEEITEYWVVTSMAIDRVVCFIYTIFWAVILTTH